MRALNALRRILLLLLLIPVVAICLDTLLRASGARPRNPIVSFVRDVASVFIIEPFRTVFPDQSYVQDAIVALVAYGVIALLIVFLFRGLAAMVGTRPPRPQAKPEKPVASKPAAPPAAKPAGSSDTAPAEKAGTETGSSPSTTGDTSAQSPPS